EHDGDAGAIAIALLDCSCWSERRGLLEGAAPTGNIIVARALEPVIQARANAHRGFLRTRTEAERQGHFFGFGKIDLAGQRNVAVLGPRPNRIEPAAAREDLPT